MTVRHHAEEFFYTTPAEVASAVRALLARHPPYSRTRETVKETEFKTNVKPNGWFWDTEMTIKVQSEYEGTRLIANTKSQWFIWATSLVSMSATWMISCGRCGWSCRG
jgi:hypothetical protein